MPRPITEDDTGLKVLVGGDGNTDAVEYVAILPRHHIITLLIVEASLQCMAGVRIQMIPGVSFANLA